MLQSRIAEAGAEVATLRQARCAASALRAGGKRRERIWEIFEIMDPLWL